MVSPTVGAGLFHVHQQSPTDMPMSQSAGGNSSQVDQADKLISLAITLLKAILVDRQEIEGKNWDAGSTSTPVEQTDHLNVLAYSIHYFLVHLTPFPFPVDTNRPESSLKPSSSEGEREDNVGPLVVSGICHRTGRSVFLSALHSPFWSEHLF